MGGDAKSQLSEGAIVLIVGTGLALGMIGLIAVSSGRSLEENREVGRDADQDQVEQLQSDLEFAQQEAADRQTTIDRLHATVQALQGEQAAASGADVDELERTVEAARADEARLAGELVELRAELAALKDSQADLVVAALDADPTGGSDAAVETPDELPPPEGTPDLDLVALEDVRVVGAMEEIDLAVLNVGRIHGIRAGMSFRVLRDTEPIAVVLVDEVTDTQAGATVESRDGDRFPRIADRAILVTSN